MTYLKRVLIITIVFYASSSLAFTPFSSYVKDSAKEQQPKSGFIASFENRVVTFVHKTVQNLRYSAYKLGGRHFDTERGVYVVDCSSYVDYILQTVYPNAYFSLVNSSRSEKPTSRHYFDFINDLPDGPKHYWSRVDEVKQLRPGDVLVFRYKNNKRTIAGGHVMMVMDEPVHDKDAWFVRVADSAPTGHSQDTRPKHVSGIGIGTLLLKTNPHTGELAAYAWKAGAAWKRNVNFAMARPIGLP